MGAASKQEASVHAVIVTSEDDLDRQLIQWVLERWNLDPMFLFSDEVLLYVYVR